MREHWSKKHKRHKAHRAIIRATYSTLVKNQVKLPVNITFTRIAPRSLDEDNFIGGAMKNVKDIVADLLLPGLASGRADGDDRISWQYKQEKGAPKEYALKIEIQEL